MLSLQCKEIQQNICTIIYIQSFSFLIRFFFVTVCIVLNKAYLSMNGN